MKDLIFVFTKLYSIYTKKIQVRRNFQVLIFMLFCVYTLVSCNLFFGYDSSTKLTNKKWVLSDWQFLSSGESVFEDLSSLIVEEQNQTKLFFNADGTFEGITPSAYFNETSNEPKSGSWTYDENTKLLLFNVGGVITDTLTIVSITDSELKVQLSDYQSWMLIYVFNTFDLLDSSYYGESIVWVYKLVEEKEVIPGDESAYRISKVEWFDASGKIQEVSYLYHNNLLVEKIGKDEKGEIKLNLSSEFTYRNDTIYEKYYSLKSEKQGDNYVVVPVEELRTHIIRDGLLVQDAWGYKYEYTDRKVSKQFRYNKDGSLRNRQEWYYSNSINPIESQWFEGNSTTPVSTTKFVTTQNKVTGYIYDEQNKIIHQDIYEFYNGLRTINYGLYLHDGQWLREPEDESPTYEYYDNGLLYKEKQYGQTKIYHYEKGTGNEQIFIFPWLKFYWKLNE